MPLPTVGGNSGLTVSSFRSSPNYPGPPPSSAQNKTMPSSKQQSSFAMMNMNDTDFDSESRLPMAKDPSGVYSVLMTDSDMALTKRKFVKVSSVGEVEVSPDRIEFCVQITSTKADMAAARESIRKRDDFIMLALKKLGVAPSGISATSMVKKYKLEEDADEDDDILEAKILRDVGKQLSARKSKRGKESSTNNNINDTEKDPVLDTERIKVVKELYVVCSNLNQYMELFSIINEKLDRQVNVSPPVIRITPECLQMQSQAAAKKAMDNAVLKASQILQSQKNLKATVGKLFYTIEDSLTVMDIAEYQNIHTSTAFESLKWKRNNKLVVCKLTSLFEVNTVKTRRVII